MSRAVPTTACPMDAGSMVATVRGTKLVAPLITLRLRRMDSGNDRRLAEGVGFELNLPPKPPEKSISACLAEIFVARTVVQIVLHEAFRASV